MVSKQGRRVGDNGTTRGSEARLEVMSSAFILEVHADSGGTQKKKTLPVRKTTNAIAGQKPFQQSSSKKRQEVEKSKGSLREGSLK